MPEIRDEQDADFSGSVMEFARSTRFNATMIANLYKNILFSNRHWVEFKGKYCGKDEEKLKSVSRMEGKLKVGLFRLQEIEKDPIYLELIASPKNWNCVQIAKVPSAEVERPQVEQKNIFLSAKDREGGEKYIANTQRISGTGVVRAKSAFVVSGDDINGGRGIERIIKEINKNFENYALILNGIGFTSIRIVQNLRDAFEFHNISNAAAIISNCNCANEPYSHFNGAVRDAQILLLASNEYSKELLNSLKHGGEENKVNMIVYANEREGEGFAAFEK